MLTRGIDLDPFELTIGQKIFCGAKRVCIVLAIGAVALSALDLMNIRSVANATEFIHRTGQRVADLMASGILSTAMAAPSPYAIAMIPRGEIAVAPHLPRSAVVDTAIASAAPPVAEHAVVRDFDAVEGIMEPPPALATSASPAMPVSADRDPLPVSPIAPVSVPTSSAIAPDTVPLPRPAPAAPPPPSPAELLHLKGNARAKAERCLADAIYFEARGETERGQEAVAQVVMNRVFSPYYPNDVCGVVYQNASHHLACQFTFACDGKSKAITEHFAWARAKRIAKQTLDGRIWEPDVAKATHYHAVYVRPIWTREMKRLAHYGVHTFYRPWRWGDGSKEVEWSITERNMLLKKTKLTSAN